ncbi:hypothetical protein AAG906_018016 [Vitis piasezkii]
MCGGDDHLAWKHPVSSEVCRGLHTAGGTPSLHLGASEGLQSLFDHSWDSVFPLLVSSESASRSVRVWCGFVILGQSKGEISSVFREVSSRPPWLLFRRVSDSSWTWDDLDSIPVTSLPAKFRMPDIERYAGIGCPCVHLQLCSNVMRVHGLDESQMITMFPLSLSGATQH